MSRRLPEGKKSRKGKKQTTYPATPKVLALLSAALKTLGTKEAVAVRVGRSRTAISLYMRDEYPSPPWRFEAAVVEAFQSFECPWSGEWVKDEDCNTRFNAPAQSASPAAHKQWKACQVCLLRKE